MEPVSVDHLMGLILLGDMPEDTKRLIAGVFQAVSEEIDVPDGETLMREDYMAFGSGYVLVHGAVQIEKGDTVLSEVAAPAILGEMSQFKAGDTRTATVRAKGPAVALHFHWDDFYACLRERVSEAEQLMLRDRMERLVWDRFGCRSVVDIPLFHDLDDTLKVKVCVVFPWIVEPAAYVHGDVVFKEGERCLSTGHLLTRGALKLAKGIGHEKTYESPNLVGIMPKQDPSQTWTATAIAQGDVEVFTFSWKTFTAKLQERLTSDEQRRLVDSMKRNAAGHFWY